MDKNELSFAQLKELGFSVVINHWHNQSQVANFFNGK